MSGTRRGFLALIGGSLASGGAFISGTVHRAKAAEVPTLLLPPSMSLVLPEPRSRPLLEVHETQMRAILHVKKMLPDSTFAEWLEGGLRQARFYAGRDTATMERIVEAAVEKHGSIIAAMRAGAI